MKGVDEMEEYAWNVGGVVTPDKKELKKKLIWELEKELCFNADAYGIAEKIVMGEKLRNLRTDLKYGLDSVKV